jgi:predicted HAD superfamily phosphohydrolase YqeG
MEAVKISNLGKKGCEKVIADKLREAGVKEIEIDLDNGIVLFEGDRKKALIALNKSGHPEEGSLEVESKTTQAKIRLKCFLQRVFLNKIKAKPHLK